MIMTMKRYSILLVDDEEIICKTVGNDLIDAGYDVHFARSGEEALRLLSWRGNRARNYRFHNKDV